MTVLLFAKAALWSRVYVWFQLGCLHDELDVDVSLSFKKTQHAAL